jgi:DnaJ-class molecular chaperone
MVMVECPRCGGTGEDWDLGGTRLCSLCYGKQQVEQTAADQFNAARNAKRLRNQIANLAEKVPADRLDRVINFMLAQIEEA